MIKLLKSELFRIKKDKFPLIAFALIILGYLSATLLAGVGNHQTKATILSSSWMDQYYLAIKLSVFILLYVWCQEFRNGTIKNTVSSGYGIETIYLSKLLVQFILCIGLVLWAVICFGLCFLMLKNADADISSLAIERAKGLGILILYVFAEISIADILYHLIKKETIIFILYFLAADKAGSILSSITGVSLFEKISVGNGYTAALSLNCGTDEKFTAVISMICHILLVNLIMYFILRRNIRYEN